MKHHETTNQTKSPTLPLGRQLHFAKLLRHKSRHIMKLFPTLHLAAASDPVTGAAATVIRRLQGSAELPQQRHHRAVAFLGRHQQRRQTSGRPGTGGRTRWIESLCSRNLGNPLGVLKGFCPTIQYSFKRVLSAR